MTGAGENCIFRSLGETFIFIKYYQDTQIKEDIGGSCSTHGGGEKWTQFVLRSLKGRDLFGELRRWEYDTKTDLKVCDDVNWIRLAEDWAQCLALLNAVMNFGFHKGKDFIDYVIDY